MDLLQQARAEIDTVDAEMAALFERRMRAVADVVRYKAETGKPVFDAAREAAVLDKNTARITDEALRPYYRAFLSDAMSISRAYQRARLGRDTAAYQGVPGAWSHIALRRLFPFARETACTTWGEVFDAVQNGDAQFGVLPFENSNAGDVSTVLDLLYTHPDIIIARMCDLPIRQDLLGVPGATLETVRTVISHPQALAQSSVFVQQHGFKTSTWGNTAGPPCGRAERPERCGYCQRRDRRAVRPADLVRGHQRRRRQHNAVHRDRACRRRPRHDRRGPAAGAVVHGTP